MRSPSAFVAILLFFFLVVNVFAATTIQFQNTTNIKRALSASASTNTTLPMTGQPVSFSCKATGGSSPYAYQWAFGDGQSATGSHVSHTYTLVRTYDVTCTVTDSQTTSANSTIILVVG